MLAVDAAPRIELGPDAESLMPTDSLVRAAITVASRDLAEALRTTHPGHDSAARKRVKLRRYLIRMSTRATPFGLFAGMGMIEWASHEASDVSLAPGPLVTRTRPDMGWLLGVVGALEADSMIRRHLPLVTSSVVTFRGDRVLVAGTSTNPGASVRASPVVRQVLAAANEPTPFDELVTLAGSAPGATPRKATRLVDQLWNEGFLCSVLRPPLTGGDPTAYVRSCLDSIPAASAWTKGFDRLQTTLQNGDSAGPERQIDALAAAHTQMDVLHPISKYRSSIQTDLRLPLAGNRLREDVGREAAEAARLLLLFNARSPWAMQLDGYRQRFVAKYGYDRQVPLLEMLDPDVGLGAMAAQQTGFRSDQSRSQHLLDLAVQANRDHQLVVELTDRQIADLEVHPQPAYEYPPSMEICVAVAAASNDALDHGQFQIVVSPNVGALAAGRHLGRFADLLGSAAADALAAVAQVEQQCSRAALAEIVYLPARGHAANVTIRPAVRTYEIVVDTSAGVSEDRVIPLNEIFVGVHEGRFVLSWPRGGTEIVAMQGHMLNVQAAPPAVKFLLAAAAQGRCALAPFPWGPAANLAFLPRVQRGRIVLALARWRISPGTLPASAGADTFAAALSTWRIKWRLPRHVYLAHGDNRLLLDLDAADHVELLHDELRKAIAAKNSVFIQEGLPGPEHAWLAGPTGRHLCELVVPLLRRRLNRQPPTHHQRIYPDAVPAVDRIRPPGTDWLYLKLYCPAWRRDEVIGDALRAFADFATRTALANGWFFIRYADPHPHIRIRFRGDPAILIGHLMPQVCQWASELIQDGVCSKYSFDTYEREVERYGGQQGISLAERIFMADSCYVAEVLHAVAEKRLSRDPLTLAIVSTDDLLASLGLPLAARTAFYRAAVPTTPSGGREYRRRKSDLRKRLSQGGDVELAHLMAARSKALAGVVGPFTALHNHPDTDLYRSYVHMHFNRILGTGREDEQLMLELIRRTRDGLGRSQINSPHPTVPDTAEPVPLDSDVISR
jgi:thiopeptide-type bacteriocin biosynthesis protein